MFASISSDVSSNLIKIDRLNYIQTDFNLWLSPHTVYSKAKTKLDNLTKQQDFKNIDFRLHKMPKSFLDLQNQNFIDSFVNLLCLLNYYSGFVFCHVHYAYFGYRALSNRRVRHFLFSVLGLA